MVGGYSQGGQPASKGGRVPPLNETLGEGGRRLYVRCGIYTLYDSMYCQKLSNYVYVMKLPNNEHEINHQLHTRLVHYFAENFVHKKFEVSGQLDNSTR